jgi:hypothetical protein
MTSSELGPNEISERVLTNDPYYAVQRVNSDKYLPKVFHREQIIIRAVSTPGMF